MSKAALRASIVLLAVGGLTLGAAGPAVAAGNALPVTDAMYAFSCIRTEVPSVLVVDAQTGESAGISPDTGDCKYNAAYDEATGTIYVNDFEDVRLSTLDPATGVVTPGPNFTLSGESMQVESIAIGQAGEAYALRGGAVYSLSLDSGVLTEIVGFTSMSPFWSFAYDPATEEFYALNDHGELYLVNRGTLTLDPIGTLPVLATYIYGLQFDSSGLLWYVDSNGFSMSVLKSATLADLANPVESGALTWSDESYYSFSLAITRPVLMPVPAPEPALAATGADTPTMAAATVVGIAAVLLGVGALAGARRRTA